MNPKKWRGWCANNCGKPVSKGATKYCSLKCQHEFQFQTRSKLLEAGQYPATILSNGFLRRYLIATLGERCTRCNWQERHPKTGRVPIEVEHIDGDWRNNSIANLTLLCPNCHALTLTYRGLNRGKGRAFRKGGRSNP
ncbi:MAG: HNH endonuclease [Candidatus Eremiobacteraeota bacterium]|nr:HNH endonuclease [Candidatus Eremiobacteraeota bacterium]